MKRLDVNGKTTALIFAMILLIGGGHSIGYADNIAGPHWHDTSTTRSIAENSATGTNVGAAVTAHNFTAGTYSHRYILDGTDKASFNINSSTGQITSNTTLDYEDKDEYSVTVKAQAWNQTGTLLADGQWEDKDSITVTINVTNVPLAFLDANGEIITEATLSIPENVPVNTNVGEPFSIQDPDDLLGFTAAPGDALTSEDWRLFRKPRFVNGTVQLRTTTQFDNGPYLSPNYETKSSYRFRIRIQNRRDGTGESVDFVTIVNIEDINEFAPEFTDGDDTSRDIVENVPAGTEIGDPVAAPDGDTADIITYTLSGTADAPDDYKSFDIDSETGQLLTKYPLDYEVKTEYEVTVTASDGEFSDTISVTINVIDLVPTFIEGETATRSIAENTARGVNIGDPVTATGPDIGYTLTYSHGGTEDASNDYLSFDIDPTNGQLITKAALNYEVKSAYEVMVTVSDGNHPADTIIVTITVTDQTEGAVAFPSGTPTTYSIPENTPSGVAIGFPVAAINLPASFTYSLTGTNRSIFTLDTNTGQLRTHAPLDYETKNAYSVNVNLDYTPVDMSVTVSHSITINVLNVNEAPMFADERTVRSIPENIGANQNIGAALTATDPDITSSNTDANPETTDADALTYTLGGTDAASFNINSATGQLTTKTGVTLDATTKDRYDVAVTVSDSEFTDTIDVVININAMPTVLIGAPTKVQTGAFDVLVTFSEAVDGFAADDITLTLNLTAGTGTASATLQSGSDGDINYTVRITPPDDAEGSVAIEVGAGAATSTANTTTTAASSQYTVALDTRHPTITVTGVPPTTTGQFSVLFTFSEPVTGFAANDITISAVAATVTVIGSGAEYIATFTPTGSGALIFTVSKDRARDAAGNGNTLLGFHGSTVSLGSPTVTITAPTTTQTGPFDVTISFSENVTGFAASDISLKKSGMTEDFEATVTNLIGGPRVYAATITPTKDGDIDISVPANAAEDNAANGNTASGTQTVTVELSGPAITITGVPTTPQNSAFDITIEFSQEVTGFLQSEISLGDGVSATVTNMTRSDASYTVTITPAANLEETIMLSVPAGVATNTSSENNVASSVYPIQLDTVLPTVNITGPTGTQTGAFEITITFSEAVTDFEQTDISLTGSTATATVTDFTEVSSTKYTAEITPTTQGDVLISVPANAAEDSATNGNTVSDTLTVTVDLNEAPVFDEEAPTREVMAIASADENIGHPVSATDPDITDTNTDANPETADIDALTYLLGGRDAAAFSIDSETGQLKTLERTYHTQSDYTVVVTVSDGTLIDSITVNITVGMTAICDRTEQVRDAIVAAVPGVTDCANVTEAHLAAITSLNLSNKMIAALKASDFEGLTALTTLYLDNNLLTALPAEVFDETTALTQLFLNSNDLTMLPAGVFDQLTALTKLFLNDNDLTMLPAGVFESLTALTELFLDNNDISRFPAGVFDQLTALTELHLNGNDISRFPAGVFDQLTALTDLNLHNNKLTDLRETVFDELTALETLNLHSNKIRTLPAAVFDNLTALTELSLNDNLISTLPAEVFDGPTALETLNLHNNNISSLPDGVFEGLTALTGLTLNDNTVDPLPLTVSLKQVALGEFKATVHTGAPFGIVLPITVTNGTLDNSATTITIPIGNVESESLTVTRTTGTTDAVTLDIGTVPGLPSDHTGYALSKSSDLPLTVISEVINNAPEFTDGESTTRSVAENTGAGENIGSAVAATDDDTTDTLTYALSGTDAGSFDIDTGTGQLKTKAALDYETDNSYSVTVSVSDGTDSDSIDVTISVTNVNEAPVFPATATRSVAENTAAGTNFGAPVSATDPDIAGDNTDADPDDATADALAYSLGGTDATSFDIVGTSGQLKTKTGLNYETKDSYTVTVTASDSALSDSITVTISVTNVNEAPAFATTTATRSVAENTAANTNIGAAVSATDPDIAGDNTDADPDDATADALAYSLGGTDAPSFDIVGTSGQLKTKTGLNYETKDSYTVTVTASDSALSDSITVTITVTNVNEAPAFSTDTATFTISESATVVGTVTATDPDAGNTITYTLEGTDAASFSINNSGQLSLKTGVTLTAGTYTVTVKASDSTLSDTIDVTVTVTSLPVPTITGVPTTPQNSAFTITITFDEAVNGFVQGDISLGSGVNATVTAFTGSDGDTTYTATITPAANLEEQITISVAAGVANSVANNNANAASSTHTLRLDTVSPTVSITNVPTGTQNSAFTVTITFSESVTGFAASDITLTGTATATATLTGSGTTYITTITPTTDGNVSIQVPAGAAQDAANNNNAASATHTVTIEHSVDPPVPTGDRPDAVLFVQQDGEDKHNQTVTGPFELIMRFAQAVTGFDQSDLHIRDNGTRSTITGWSVSADRKLYTAAITPQASGSVTFEVPANVAHAEDDGQGNVRRRLYVQVNLQEEDTNSAPVFTSNSPSRSIPENTAANTNIGAPVAATDLDGDTLTHSLSGTPDAASFNIDTSNGQLKTKTALDYETKFQYTVTVEVSDGNGGTTTVDVTINVTNVNEAPAFATTTATRSVEENTAANTNIGTAITATDPDSGDTVTYSIDATADAVFDIDSTSGQLKTEAALDYESTTSYTATVTATDSGNLTDTITVTINVINVNETPTNNAPVFTEGDSTNRSVAENTAAAENIGSAVAATDANSDPLTYSLKAHTDDADDYQAFDIDSSTGQLKTKDSLDHETQSTYKVTVEVSDGNGGTDTITVTITVTDIDETGPNRPPVFASDSTKRSIVEGTTANRPIGAPVAATDPDGNTLTYSLSGTDAASFSIDTSNGQLKTKVALNRETKSQYTVTVEVSDGNEGTDTITVTINVVLPDHPEAVMYVKQNGVEVHDQIVVLAPFQLVMRFDQAVTDFEQSDLTLNDFNTGSTITGWNGSDGDKEYTATVKPKNTGSVTFKVPANTVRAKDDGQGNVQTKFFVQVVTADQAAPASDASASHPNETLLLPNYPNPFNPETWMPYQLSKSANVTLTIYNMRGVVVRKFALGHQLAGYYTNRSRAIHWDGRNNIGERVASGVYFYLFKAGKYTATRKMLIRK